MAIRRVEDFLGNAVEFPEGWFFSGVRARSNAEKDALAREAVEARCKQWVLEKKAEGQSLDYDHIDLIANRNQDSDTDHAPNGVRTHRCWGTGVAHLFVNV